MSDIWSEQNKVHLVVPPAYDTWATAATGTAVHMENYKRCTFLIPTGSTTSNCTCGSATITVLAGTCSTGAETEIDFKYRTCSSGNVYGALTDSTGFTTTNALEGANWTYVIEVDASTVADAGTDFDVVKLSLTEVEDKPVLSCAIAVLSEPRYPQAILQSSTT